MLRFFFRTPLGLAITAFVAMIVLHLLGVLDDVLAWFWKAISGTAQEAATISWPYLEPILTFLLTMGIVGLGFYILFRAAFQPFFKKSRKGK